MISYDQVFTLGPNIGSHMLSIGIIDDDIFEAEVENFAIQLSILNATGLHGLRLGTQRVDLIIQDDDCKLSYHYDDCHYQSVYNRCHHWV